MLLLYLFLVLVPTVKPVLDLNDITPYEQMNAGFAKKITGGEELDEVQKQQIREQQHVSFNDSPIMLL